MCRQVYLYGNDFIRLCVVISVGFQEKMFEKFACRTRGRGESQSTFQKDHRKMEVIQIQYCYIWYLNIKYIMAKTVEAKFRKFPQTNMQTEVHTLLH